MADWRIDSSVAHLPEFATLEAVFALSGERLTSDPLSEVVRIERDGIRYYVKRYHGAGKGLRRYVGRPRVKAEWQNLKRFAKWGIATAPVVAWGMGFDQRQYYLAAQAKGRTSDDEITLFDGTGVGLQDLAVAAVAVTRARERVLGIEVGV